MFSKVASKRDGWIKFLKIAIWILKRLNLIDHVGCGGGFLYMFVLEKFMVLRAH